MFDFTKGAVITGSPSILRGNTTDLFKEMKYLMILLKYLKLDIDLMLELFRNDPGSAKLLFILIEYKVVP